ncbi:MAG TPA: DUF58 domain-containing protein [Acidimicrobiales bacterium]|nr:DUF58 domain-containing protein [Acidimicrobiales bacterium]
MTAVGGNQHARTDEILRRLELTVAHRLDGLLHGDHLGLVPGHGSELGETRGYVAGDDVRRIDWNVTARMQTPYLRSTIADRELETWVVLDRSGSLNFGTAQCTKADLALAATGAIGFLTAHTGNRIGALFVDPGSDRVIPARGGRGHLMQILRLIAAAAPPTEGTVDLARSLERLAPMLHRRGLVVVISDFLSDADWKRPLRLLATRHEVLAIEIVDPRELDLPDVGAVALYDPETGRSIRVDTSSTTLRARYRAAAEAQRAEMAATLRGAGVEHLQLRTDRDWVKDLVRYVALRRRRLVGPAAVRVAR